MGLVNLYFDKILIYNRFDIITAGKESEFLVSKSFYKTFDTYPRMMVHKCEMRVRYSDTDQMKRMHHAAYAEYLEVARIEMLRSRGFSYAEMEKDGYILPVIHLQVRYLGGAEYDDVIRIETIIHTRSEVRVAFESTIYIDDRKIVEAEVELACLDRDSWRPKRLPPRLCNQ